MTIGQRLREAREQAGHHDEKSFCELMEITVATLRAWEANIERPSDEQLERFAALTGIDAAPLSHLAHQESAQGICSAVELIPERAQAEVLEQVGIPPVLWASEDVWVAFLRVARASAAMSAEELTLLAEHSEACVAGEGV